MVALVVPAIEDPVGGGGCGIGELVTHLNGSGGVGSLGAGSLRGIVDGRHGVVVGCVGEVGGIGAVASAVGQSEGVGSLGADKFIVIEPTGKTILRAGRSSRQRELRTLRDSQRRVAGIVLIILNLDSTASGVVGCYRDGTVLRYITEHCININITIDNANRIIG